MKRLAAAVLFAVLMTAAGCGRNHVPSPDPIMNQGEPRHIPVTPRFTAMKMAAATDGWALAGHRVLVLTDRGQSWRDVTPPDLAVTSPQMVPMQAVFHVEDHWRVWLAVSQHGGPTPGLAVYRTEDGGITWEKSAALPVQGAPGSIDVLNQRNAWLTVGTSLFASRDGGATWEQGGTLPFAGQVDFVKEQTGYLAGQEGLQVTRDGGRTWAPVELPASELANVRFPVPPVGDVGLVLDERAGLFRTTDAGATWELMSSLRPVSAAAFHTTMEGWVWTCLAHWKAPTYGSAGSGRRVTAASWYTRTATSLAPSRAGWRRSGGSTSAMGAPSCWSPGGRAAGTSRTLFAVTAGSSGASPDW